MIIQKMNLCLSDCKMVKIVVQPLSYTDFTTHLGGDLLELLKHCPLKATVILLEETSGSRTRSRLILDLKNGKFAAIK